MNWLIKYEKFKPFTPLESWGLFRLAAFGEAIGWTLLIIGILINKYIFPGGIAVQIAGQFHGTLFLIYITAVIILYPSQSWGRKRTIIAGLASVPPYGSLAFEMWESRRRKNEGIKRQLTLLTYANYLS